jgi:hypothetical protein
MKTLIEKIRVMTGIPQQDVDDWLDVSEEAIFHNEVERLSLKGLLQCIDRIAYELATDTHLYLSCEESSENEKLWEEALPEHETMMDDLHDVIALASGIHPDILFELCSLRADHYSSLYIQMMGHHD